MSICFNKKTIGLVFSIVAAVMLTSCGQDRQNAQDKQNIQNKESNYEILDEQMLDSENTTVAERREYYDDHVDSLVDNMTDQEKEEYYVTVNIKKLDDAFNPYSVYLSRNDNESVDNISIEEDCEKLPPGVYRIITYADNLEEDMAIGELAILSPGEEVTLKVNERRNKIRVTKGGKVTKIYEETIYGDVDYPDDNPLYMKAEDAPKLEMDKLDPEKTGGDELSEYYEKNVSAILDRMTEEEQEKYRITVHLQSENKTDYPLDVLHFIRNDSVHCGMTSCVYDGIELNPGIYYIMSRELPEGQQYLGEFAILTPGSEVTIDIDYEQRSIEIIEGDGEVTETN